MQSEYYIQAKAVFTSERKRALIFFMNVCVAFCPLKPLRCFQYIRFCFSLVIVSGSFFFISLVFFPMLFLFISGVLPISFITDSLVCVFRPRKTICSTRRYHFPRKFRRCLFNVPIFTLHFLLSFNYAFYFLFYKRAWYN